MELANTTSSVKGSTKRGIILQARAARVDPNQKSPGFRRVNETPAVGATCASRAKFTWGMAQVLRIHALRARVSHHNRRQQAAVA
jgi:hypothetical protein